MTKQGKITHQTQRQARKQSGQAKDNIWSPHGNPQLLRHVVMTTLEITRDEIFQPTSTKQAGYSLDLF